MWMFRRALTRLQLDMSWLRIKALPLSVYRLNIISSPITVSLSFNAHHGQRSYGLHFLQEDTHEQARGKRVLL